MQLTSSQVERFYKIWFPLLCFVNDKYRLVDKSRTREPWDPRDASILKDALWSDDALRELFIERNPASLSAIDLEIVRNCQHRVSDTFLIVKHLKKYSVFLAGESAYGVVGLNCPIEELYDPPTMVKGTLIPFENKITYDSLFTYYPISFGRNMKGNLKREYQAIKSHGNIIESLEVNMKNLNEKILQEYTPHLNRS